MRRLTGPINMGSSYLKALESRTTNLDIRIWGTFQMGLFRYAFPELGWTR